MVSAQIEWLLVYIHVLLLQNQSTKDTIEFHKNHIFAWYVALKNPLISQG